MISQIKKKINSLSVELQKEINGTVNHANIIGKIEAYKDILNLLNKDKEYTYMGCNITKNTKPNTLKYTAYAKDTFVHADTLQGIKDIIKHTLKGK